MALIRTASELDVPAITEIYAHYVRHSAATFEIEPPDGTEMRRRHAEVIARGLPYLVAEVESRVAGYAYAGPYRIRPAYRFTLEDSVYVHPDSRTHGLGRMMLSRVIEMCEAAGYRQMIAVIGDSGNVASIRLHEKLGFRRAGVLQSAGRKFGRWIDSVLMQRALCSDERVAQLKQIVERGESRMAILQQVADVLRQSGNHRWVGLYDVDYAAEEVRNVVFTGPAAPAFPNFSIYKGLTGVTVRERRTVNIGDVSANPDYLTALGTTRSEIIVPIFDHSRNAVIGTIDIESDKPQAFSERDEIFLEDCAEILRPLWSS